MVPTHRSILNPPQTLPSVSLSPCTYSHHHCFLRDRNVSDIQQVSELPANYCSAPESTLGSVLALETLYYPLTSGYTNASVKPYQLPQSISLACFPQAINQSIKLHTVLLEPQHVVNLQIIDCRRRKTHRAQGLEDAGRCYWWGFTEQHISNCVGACDSHGNKTSYMGINGTALCFTPSSPRAYHLFVYCCVCACMCGYMC